MRKLLKYALILLLALLARPALAEIHVLDDLRATVEIPESYIQLTSSNLSSNAQWLESRGLTADAVRKDFEERGVLFQCWTEEYDACFELTALQTDQSTNIFDVNEQETTVRGAYRLMHYPENAFTNEGYNFSSADWKNTPSGRFLILRYIKRDGGEIVHRGLMRRTIRNGYEITFDMQVFGRSVTNKDNTALNKIWDTFKFVEILPLPPAASAKINITDMPPTETNSDSFTIEGTAAKGVELTAVVMGLSYPTPINSKVEVGSSGKFKLPIKLPKEGAFVITMFGEYGGEVVWELDPPYSVTYHRTFLAVNVTTPIPTVITADSFTILGTSEPGASIQVFLNNNEMIMKKVTAAGKFKIDIDTSAEGTYELLLVFSKKGLADRRIPYTFERKWSEADMLKELKSQAIKPSHATLIKKIKGYEGRIMGYKCYMLSAKQSGDTWIAEMALTKKGDEYSGIIWVACDEKPDIPIGGRITMYGTCVGMSVPNDEDETQASYPCFELLLFVSLE